MTAKNPSKYMLIVDDEKNVLSPIQEYVTRLGYNCKTATCPDQALQMLNENPYNLVVSDIIMPKMDGIQFMKEAKKSYPSLDFIIMTGYTADYSYVDIIDAGAADFLRKPFDMKELRAKIGRVERENRILEELKEKNAQLKKRMAETKEMAMKAEAANISKSRFLANMSHEIRTPLNAVVGFTVMLLETQLDNTQKDYVTTIQRSGEALVSLLNDVLDFSKIEAGELDFEIIDFDPELVGYDVCEMIRPRIALKPVEILYRVEDDLPPKVRGDPFRFRQVLTNLMSNAAKFTSSGEIELFVGVEEANENGVKLHATVRDTGIGIPEDKISEIFNPFHQADDSVTRQYGGTGLGLSICKQIASLLNGDVWLGNEVTTGSIFHFTGWFDKAEDKKAKRYKPVTLSNRKALIVDDNPTNLDILSHSLKSLGIHVKCLVNGQETENTLLGALEANDPFDLCILDIQMPVVSGYNVAEKIRAPESPFKNLPLIALSSLHNGAARKCETIGFDGFLSKPIHREKLYQMLERVLGESEDHKRKDAPVRQKMATQYSVREDRKHSARILLVEDNPVNQKLARIILNKAGYHVETANNGSEAVDMYMKTPQDFDLVFMDVQMPEMDGIEATKSIRKAGFKDIPIVALTSHALKGDREKCLKAGMNDYITKPIKREFVFDVLNKLVFSKRGSVKG